MRGRQRESRLETKERERERKDIKRKVLFVGIIRRMSSIKTVLAVLQPLSLSLSLSLPPSFPLLQIQILLSSVCIYTHFTVIFPCICMDYGFNYLSPTLSPS
jgi:hypothetical protein